MHYDSAWNAPREGIAVNLGMRLFGIAWIRTMHHDYLELVASKEPIDLGVIEFDF